MADVLISTARGDMPAYVAAPRATDQSPGSKAPGVVVIHDIFGMTPDHRHQADWSRRAALWKSPILSLGMAAALT